MRQCGEKRWVLFSADQGPAVAATPGWRARTPAGPTKLAAS
jgi:hypothetical protein